MKRRQFISKTALGSAGVYVSDIFKIYTAILATSMKEAHAQVTGQTLGRRYLNLHLEGGPGRWTFDQWLTPNTTDPTLNVGASNFNIYSATGFQNNVPAYLTTTYKNVKVPIMFSGSVGVGSGAATTKPLTNLLDNMAVIRGYNSLFDGHETNRPLQLFPDPAVPSLLGIAADNRNDAISAVTTQTQSRPYKSGFGKSLFTITSQGYGGNGGVLLGLMKTFQTVATAQRGIATVDSASTVINQFHDSVKSQMATHFPRAAVTVDHLKSVKDLAIYASSNYLTNQYIALYNKYSTIMNAALRSTPNQPGFSSGSITAESAFRNHDGYMIKDGYDLRAGFSAAYMDQTLIDSLVLAEFCFTNNICGSLMLGNYGMIGNIQTQNEAGQLNGIQTAGDQHGEPGKVVTLLNAGFYLGMSAGLLELINTLKSQPEGSGNKFDNTVIHVTGDFGRTPDGGGGSGHGWQAQVSSIFSGIINTPFIVGNISSQGLQYGAQGMWGVAAPVDFSGTKEVLSPRHMAAAVAHALGATNPWPFTPLVWQIDPTTKKLIPKVTPKII